MTRKLLLHIRRQYAGFLALFVALGGTSYALAAGSIGSREIANNSIGSLDVRNNTLRSVDVFNNTLTGRDIKNGSIYRRDLAPGVQLSGPTGPTGVMGSPGPRGPRGAGFVRTTQRRAPAVATCKSEGCTTSSIAKCAAGERATGGGFEVTSKDVVYVSEQNHQGWIAKVTDRASDRDATASVIALVMCAS